MSGIFQIGVSALLAAQRGLSTTSNNIANASTPGYSRQTVSFAEREPTFAGGGFLGNGVDVSSVSRAFNTFANLQVISATGSSSQQAELLSLSQQINELLASDTGGLSDSLNRFFNSISEFATNPTDTSVRKAVLIEATSLEQSFNTLSDRFEEFRSNTQQTARNIVADINQRTASLAQINVELQAAGEFVSNNLLDKRDQEIRELAALVGVTTVEAENGITNVFTGSGQPLVLGSVASRLQVTTENGDPSSLAIRVEIGGDASTDITSRLSGGRLTGLLDFRDRILTPAENNLGRIAVAVAEEFNTIQTGGLTLEGRLGENLFRPLTTVPGTVSVFADESVGDASARLLDRAEFPQVLASAASNGALDVEIGDTSTLVGRSYRFQITAYDPGDPVGPPVIPATYDYEIVDAMDGSPAGAGSFEVGSSVTFAGVEFSYSGPAVPTDGIGDRFTVLPQPEGREASDYDVRVLSDGSYSVTRRSDGTQVDYTLAEDVGAAGTDVLAFAGIEVTVRGGTAGDRYTIAPYRYASGIFESVLAEPAELAGAAPLRGVAGSGNAGTAEITDVDIAGTSGLPLGNAGVISLVFDETVPAYDVLVGGLPTLPPTSISYDPADANLTSSGLPVTLEITGLDTISFTLSGVPEDGDRFVIRDGASGDNRNALRMEALRFEDVIDGTASLFEAYGQLVADVGSRVRQAELASEAQQTRLDAAESRRSSITGVNLEEEAANLLRMQRAFDASSRVIAVAQQTFQSLLNAVGA